MYKWLISALLFWLCLACVEVGGAILTNFFPPPLGKGVLPSGVDVRYFIAALSIYGLFSIPTVLVLWGGGGIVSWLLKKTGSSFFDLNRMDLFLLFAFGLLLFKWISNLMPYLMDADHLPAAPYLLIVPLLGLHVWITSSLNKTARYYRLNWFCIILGAILLSKTGYDVFFRSPLSIPVRGVLAVLTGGVLFLLARLFYNLLNSLLSARLKPNLASSFSGSILLVSGVVFTFNGFTTDYHPLSLPPHSAAAQQANGAAGRNVIIFLVDCLRADHLGCYGYSKETSPFIDSLAESGVMFENCIAPSSWTIPSVVSLFTGVYPQQHGMNSFGPLLPDGLATLQESMQHQGMTTAAFITNDYLKPRLGYGKGFSYYYDHYLEQTFMEYVASRLFFFNALLHFKNNLFYPRSVDPGGARWWSVGFPPFNHEKRSARRVTDDAIQWLDSHHAQPFYLYLHFMDVHSPYDTIWYPLFDRERYDSQSEREKLINTYDGRIAYVDQQIKRIWEALVRLGVSENSLVIVTADHGEELYDHEGTGHCTTLYDELIRVPLIMINSSFPGEGRRMQTQVRLIDVPPTILDFLGLPVLAQMRGKSLLPSLTNAVPLPQPAYALSYTTRGRKSLKTEEGRNLWEQKVWDQGIVQESVRAGNEWKAILGSDGNTELYNLKEDEGENTNVEAVERDKVTALQKKLDEELAGSSNFTPRQEKLELSPDARNKLKALGYL
jgi:arylsulfatase A-like enzyme